MTKLVRLLPYSRNVGQSVAYNKCLYWTRVSVYRFPWMSLYKRHTSEEYLFYDNFWNISKEIHRFSQNCGFNDEALEGVESVIPLPISVDLEDHSERFRNTLYPSSSDAIIETLKACNSVDELLAIINNNYSSLTSDHYCQFILVLWDIIKSVRTVIEPDKLKVSTSSGSSVCHKNIFGERILNKHSLNPIILRAMDVISNDLESLTSEALVCSVLYSNRLGISVKHPFIQSLLMRIDQLLLKEDLNTFTLPALSRLTIFLDEQDELWAMLALVRTLPFIYKYFDRCSNVSDFRALTISMLSAVSFLKEELLVEYEALTEELLRNGILIKNETSVITKAVVLLNNIYHKPAARHMIYRLLQMIRDDMNGLFLPYIFDVHKVVSTNLEPHYALKELDNFKTNLPRLTGHQDCSPLYYSLLDVPRNPQGSVILKELIDNASDLEVLLCIQPHLTTTHPEACFTYWKKVAQLLTVDNNLLKQVCMRYLNFKDRMGIYRHKQFESQMLSFITLELVKGTAALQPKIFAVIAAFVLSFEYSYHSRASLSDDIVPRLLSMMGQFNVDSCLHLSKGIKQGLQNRRNRALQIYLQLDSALNDRTMEIISTEGVTLISAYNMLFRSCINRKGTGENDILLALLNRCEQLEWTELSSRSLRNLVYNFRITSSLIPSAVDRMVEYCLQNRQYVTGDTVGKLVFMCYHLGYAPNHAQLFFDVTGNLIIRDCNQLHGLSLLQVALALSFFNQLPSSLIHYIFTVRFLEKLDEEIKNCFAKDKYPMRVRQMLMQLNRSVCLDQPEADVPWFHSKFCEEQQALGQNEARPKTLIFTDVLSTLVNLVSDPNLLSTRAVTPYGYTIDIQLNLDANLSPVPINNSVNAAHKLAFLMLYSDSYTVYERRLKGFYKMKQRHLEMLGYKVIGLSDSLWNAMFMAEPKAKQEYLKKLIWPS